MGETNGVTVNDVNVKGTLVECDFQNFPSQKDFQNTLKTSFSLGNEQWEIQFHISSCYGPLLRFFAPTNSKQPQFILTSVFVKIAQTTVAKLLVGRDIHYVGAAKYETSLTRDFYTQLRKSPNNTVQVACLFYPIETNCPRPNVEVEKKNVELQTAQSLYDMQSPNRKITAAAQTEEETRSDSINILNEDIQKLYTDNELCDVKIKVGPKEFLAHRAILAARSTVFSSMLKHEMVEKVDGVIDISDCDPESFEDFLKFLYSGKVETIKANFCNLYRIADKYCVDFLKNVCVDRMSEIFEVETICDVLDLASMYKETELLKKATTFFIENAKDIFATEKWNKFVVEKTSLSSEILIKMAERTQLKKE